MEASEPPFPSSTTRARTADHEVPEKGRLSFGGSSSGRPQQSKLLREETAHAAHPGIRLKGRKFSHRVATENSSQESHVFNPSSLFHPLPQPSFSPPTSSPPLLPPSTSPSSALPVPTPPSHFLSPSSFFPRGQEDSERFPSSSAKWSTRAIATMNRSTHTTDLSNLSTNPNPSCLEILSGSSSRSSNNQTRSTFPAGFSVGSSVSSGTSSLQAMLPSPSVSVADATCVKVTIATIGQPYDNHINDNNLNNPLHTSSSSSTSRKNTHRSTVTSTLTPSGDGQEYTWHASSSSSAAASGAPATTPVSTAVPKTSTSVPPFSPLATMQKVLEEKDQYILQLEVTVKTLREKLKEADQRNALLGKSMPSTASSTATTTMAATSAMMKPTMAEVAKRGGGEEESTRTSTTIRRKSSSVGVRKGEGVGDAPYPALAALAPPPLSPSSSNRSDANDLPFVLSRNGKKSLVGISSSNENRSGMAKPVQKDPITLPQSSPSASGLPPPSPSRTVEGRSVGGGGGPVFVEGEVVIEEPVLEAAEASWRIAGGVTSLTGHPPWSAGMAYGTAQDARGNSVDSSSSAAAGATIPFGKTEVVKRYTERSGRQSGSRSGSRKESTPPKRRVQERDHQNTSSPSHWRTTSSAATSEEREEEGKRGGGILQEVVPSSVSSLSNGKNSPAPLPLYSVTTVTTASSRPPTKLAAIPLPSNVSSGRSVEEKERSGGGKDDAEGKDEKNKRMGGDDDCGSHLGPRSAMNPSRLPLPLHPSPRTRSSSSSSTSSRSHRGSSTSSSSACQTSIGSSHRLAHTATASRKATHRPSVAEIIAEDHHPREKRIQEAQEGLLWCIENACLSDPQEADPAGVEYCVRSGGDVCGVIPNPEYDLLPIYFYFIKSGNVRCLQACLKTERPIDFTLVNENDGCTALIEAVRLPHLTDMETVLNAIVRRILQRGVNASKSDDIDLLEQLQQQQQQRLGVVECDDKETVVGMDVQQEGSVHRGSSFLHHPLRTQDVSGTLHESAMTTKTTQPTAVDVADSVSPLGIPTLSSSSAVSCIPSRKTSLLGSSVPHSLSSSFSSSVRVPRHYQDQGDIVDWLQADYGGRHMFMWAAQLGRLAAVWSIVRVVPYFVHKKQPIPLYGSVTEKDWKNLGTDGQQCFWTKNNH